MLLHTSSCTPQIDGIHEDGNSCSQCRLLVQSEQNKTLFSNNCGYICLFVCFFTCLAVPRRTGVRAGFYFAQLRAERIPEEIIPKSFTNLVRHQFTHSRCSTNSKQNKIKEIHKETHQSETVERQRQRKNLESSKRKAASHVQAILFFFFFLIRLSAYFSSEILEVRRQWVDILKVLKKKNQQRILYPAKLSFKNEGVTKTFPDKN